MGRRSRAGRSGGFSRPVLLAGISLLLVAPALAATESPLGTRDVDAQNGLRVMDWTPPTAPRLLRAVAGSHRVTLRWGPARDNLAVRGYRVMRAGRLVATVNAMRRTYTDRGLANGRTYRYTVRAFDAGNNLSLLSNIISVIPGSLVADPSGARMPVGDIPGWHQIFTDNFAKDVALGSFPRAVSSKWGAYPNGWADTTGRGRYNCSRVCSVHGGLLNLRLHTENGVHLVAAPYAKLPGASDQGGMLYGRYAIRFRADPVAGYKTAWLLWPDSDVWPEDGEIDFPEGDLTGGFCGFTHFKGATADTDKDSFCGPYRYNAWHTAVIEWSPNEVNFILDGNTIGTTTERIPDTPLHWVLQTETALDGPAPANNAAGNVQIDWVAVYQPA